MGFKVSTERQFTVKHTHVVETDGVKEDFPLEVTFKHLAGEDIDYGELRSKLENISDTVVINEDTGDEIDNSSYNAFLYTLRKGLISCSGFTDQNDKDITITDKKTGKVNADMQLVVFEAMRTLSEFFEKVTTAYVGTDSKN